MRVAPERALLLNWLLGVERFAADTHDTCREPQRRERPPSLPLRVDGGRYVMRVQQLSDDGRSGVRGRVSERFGPRPVEAPVLFHAAGHYFAIFGHNCWCCAEGAEAFAFVAPSPLGP